MGPGDADSARALVQRALEGTRQLGRTLELLEAAIIGTDAECIALVAADRDPSPVGAVVLFGPVAGASGVIKLHALVGEDPDTMVMLVGGLLREPAARAARMIVCEIADDAPCAAASVALRACAFTHEGRVDDYFAAGVSRDLLVRRR